MREERDFFSVESMNYLDHTGFGSSSCAKTAEYGTMLIRPRINQAEKWNRGVMWSSIEDLSWFWILVDIPCAMHRFLPCVWFAAGMLHHERERVCNERVLLLGGAPTSMRVT
jgi:hypothetical protein